ncbi:winged helix-turn-helix transcriptional regulator [Micromonospora sp. SH-82]|uniref:winged helix-turn-helix transcriptional regulator n=1 Tax=Micromonospora sp. SH-82 TaxID=3132938 RepID=UPI003EBFDEC5
MSLPVDLPEGVEPTDPDGRFVADVFARNCDSRRTLEHVASKWGILSLAALREGDYRFNALRRRVDGVSEKMLAQTLQALERDGLVRREVQTSIPPHVEYSLTPLGVRVADRLVGLIELVEGELDTVLAARAEYDRQRTDGPR